MNATITYLLTEQAQRAAMKATGTSVPQKMSVTVEITPEDLSLVEIDETGTPYLDLTQASGPYPQANWLKEAGAIAGIEGGGGRYGFKSPEPDILALLRAGWAKVEAEEQAEREKIDAAIRTFLASDAPVTGEFHIWHVTDADDRFIDISKREDELAKAYRAEARRRHEAYREEQAAEERQRKEAWKRADEERKAEQAALEAAKQHAIAEKRRRRTNNRTET